METDNIHALLEDQTVFEAVCEFLGTDPFFMMNHIILQKISV